MYPSPKTKKYYILPTLHNFLRMRKIFQRGWKSPLNLTFWSLRGSHYAEGGTDPPSPYFYNFSVENSEAEGGWIACSLLPSYVGELSFQSQMEWQLPSGFLSHGHVRAHAGGGQKGRNGKDAKSSPAKTAPGRVVGEERCGSFEVSAPKKCLDSALGWLPCFHCTSESIGMSFFSPRSNFQKNMVISVKPEKKSDPELSLDVPPFFLLIHHLVPLSSKGSCHALEWTFFKIPRNLKYYYSKVSRSNYFGPLLHICQMMIITSPLPISQIHLKEKKWVHIHLFKEYLPTICHVHRLVLAVGIQLWTRQIAASWSL